MTWAAHRKKGWIRSTKEGRTLLKRASEVHFMQHERSWWEVLVEVTSHWDHKAKPMTASTLAEALSSHIGGQVALAAAWF